MHSTIKALWWPIVPYPMDSPLDPFFWFLKMSLKNVSAVKVVGAANLAVIGWFSTKNWISWRLEVVEIVSMPCLKYSLCWRRNKNVIHVRS